MHDFLLWLLHQNVQGSPFFLSAVDFDWDERGLEMRELTQTFILRVWFLQPGPVAARRRGLSTRNRNYFLRRRAVLRMRALLPLVAVSHFRSCLRPARHHCSRWVLILTTKTGKHLRKKKELFRSSLHRTSQVNLLRHFFFLQAVFNTLLRTNRCRVFAVFSAMCSASSVNGASGSDANLTETSLCHTQLQDKTQQVCCVIWR